MNDKLNWVLIVLGLFAGMLVMIEFGRQLGLRRMARDAEGVRTGLAALEGAVFGLLGLLVAFAFSGAVSRFDVRRQLIVAEANNVGTAWLRLDLLPTSAQPPLRDLFRHYLDSRLEIYQRLPNMEAARAAWERANQLQGEIWSSATAACRSDDTHDATRLLLPALNEMFDITTQRTMAMLHHPPKIVFVLLFVLALGCSLIAGYGMAGGKHRSWMHMIVFSACVAVTVYVILDIEFPRYGLIRVDAADQALIAVRENMK